MLQPLHFRERSRKDLSKNVWVVASIFYRFRDKRQKHKHRRLNSYRGDYSEKILHSEVFVSFCKLIQSQYPCARSIINCRPTLAMQAKLKSHATAYSCCFAAALKN